MLLTQKPESDQQTDKKAMAVGATVTGRDLVLNFDGAF
jgi:hypothetical protein